MSIITFVSEDLKETGQTISIAAIATAMAIEHNYKILLFSTDFADRTLENCFWNPNKRKSIFAKQNVLDISNGIEGLVRALSSNKLSGDIIKSYTKPVLSERLDVLEAPKTPNYAQYLNMAKNFSQIAEIANETYDMVLVDLSGKIAKEDRANMLNISDIVVVNLLQSMSSINNFMKLKNEVGFYRKSSVLLMLGKYNPNSKYSNKNVARYLKEKQIPMIVPYNILFADECGEGRIIDYFLKVQKIKGYDNKDTYFINQLRGTTQYLQYKIQEKLNGTI
mgnify:CR=1 FL=1